jgi:chemotaxis signal transduction protein
MEVRDQNVPWVLLRVRDQLLGVPGTQVREMAELPAVTRVPNTPDYVLGLITLRGQVVPTIDLRARLGLPTAEQDLKEFLEVLGQGEQVHDEWFGRLTAAVGGEKAVLPESSLEQCPFTAWLAKAENGRLGRASHLVKLEPPHFGLHALAVQVLEQTQKGRMGEAAGLLREGREKELAEFRKVTGQARERLSQAHRQIAVVLDWKGRTLAVTVDEVESIERLKPGSLENLPDSPEGLVSDLTCLVGKRARDDGLVLILELAALFEGTARAAQAAAAARGDGVAQAGESAADLGLIGIEGEMAA